MSTHSSGLGQCRTANRMPFYYYCCVACWFPPSPPQILRITPIIPFANICYVVPSCVIPSPFSIVLVVRLPLYHPLLLLLFLLFTLTAVWGGSGISSEREIPFPLLTSYTQILLLLLLVLAPPSTDPLQTRTKPSSQPKSRQRTSPPPSSSLYSSSSQFPFDTIFYSFFVLRLPTSSPFASHPGSIRPCSRCQFPICPKAVAVTAAAARLLRLCYYWWLVIQLDHK